MPSLSPGALKMPAQEVSCVSKNNLYELVCAGLGVPGGAPGLPECTPMKSNRLRLKGRAGRGGQGHLVRGGRTSPQSEMIRAIFLEYRPCCEAPWQPAPGKIDWLFPIQCPIQCPQFSGPIQCPQSVPPIQWPNQCSQFSAPNLRTSPRLLRTPSARSAGASRRRRTRSLP